MKVILNYRYYLIVKTLIDELVKTISV